MAARNDTAKKVRRMSRLPWRRARSALDLPGPIGLAARRSVGLMLFAADHDVLGVFAAVLAVRQLIGLGRCHRSGVAGLRIVPDRGLAGLVLLEGLGGSLR